MKQFKRFALALAAMMLFVSPAFADPPPWDDISVLFTPEYVSDDALEAADYFTPVSLSELGDLGDESTSVAALALAAGVSAAGAIFVHKRRTRI